jgi:hypothetical protein
MKTKTLFQVVVVAVAVFAWVSMGRAVVLSTFDSAGDERWAFESPSVFLPIFKRIVLPLPDGSAIIGDVMERVGPDGSRLWVREDVRAADFFVRNDFIGWCGTHADPDSPTVCGVLTIAGETVDEHEFSDSLKIVRVADSPDDSVAILQWNGAAWTFGKLDFTGGLLWNVQSPISATEWSFFLVGGEGDVFAVRRFPAPNVVVALEADGMVAWQFDLDPKMWCAARDLGDDGELNFTNGYAGGGGSLVLSFQGHCLRESQYRSTCGVLVLSADGIPTYPLGEADCAMADITQATSSEKTWALWVDDTVGRWRVAEIAEDWSSLTGVTELATAHDDINFGTWWSSAFNRRPDGSFLTAFIGETAQFASLADVTAFSPSGVLLWDTPISDEHFPVRVSTIDVSENGSLFVSWAFDSNPPGDTDADDDDTTPDDDDDESPSADDDDDDDDESGC